jgi:hypothetical protein
VQTKDPQKTGKLLIGISCMLLVLSAVIIGINMASKPEDGKQPSRAFPVALVPLAIALVVRGRKLSAKPKI